MVEKADFNFFNPVDGEIIGNKQTFAVKLNVFLEDFRNDGYSDQISNITSNLANLIFRSNVKYDSFGSFIKVFDLVKSYRELDFFFNNLKMTCTEEKYQNIVEKFPVINPIEIREDEYNNPLVRELQLLEKKIINYQDNG